MNKETEPLLKDCLTRKQVVDLAVKTNQPIGKCLLLNGYMPDSINKAMTHTGEDMEACFEKLSTLPPENIDAMVDVLDKIYTMCERDAGKKK